VLEAAVLVLNRSYLPIQVAGVRRAFAMMYLGAARALGDDYETFDFDSWLAQQVRHQDDSVGIVGGAIRVPRVIVLTHYDRVPRRHVRFSRSNIYARDEFTCQYCGRHYTRQRLNLDHVIPRSQGGRSTWENVVCSCVDCNRRKGGRTPQQAGMGLIREPRKPRWSPLLGGLGHDRGYPEWTPFLMKPHATRRDFELAAG
jgi:5-methylcytosine-specific restriction endonuclease McrA